MGEVFYANLNGIFLFLLDLQTRHNFHLKKPFLVYITNADNFSCGYFFIFHINNKTDRALEIFHKVSSVKYQKSN